jgi:DNA helicase HerA-like ATPase
MKNAYLPLLKMPEAAVSFGKFAPEINTFKPPKAELDLFINEEKQDIDLVLTKFPVVFGQAGSGKSNAVGRMLEQVLNYKVPVLLSDITGEHEGIIELYERQFRRVNIPGDAVGDAERFLGGSSYYYDLSSVSRSDYLSYYDEFLFTFFEIKKRIEAERRIPHLLVFEEAHNLIPEFLPATDRKLQALMNVKEHIRKYALEGRKFGLSPLLITQRPSLCAKDITSQSRTRFMLKVFEKNDVDTYLGMIPGSRRRDLIAQLNAMKPGQVIFVADGKIKFNRFKLKKSRDLGQTPGYAASMGWRKNV